MLELRPICEHCACALAPESPAARICSFECTFCASCVRDVLRDVCPNCGGNFVPRPIRPARNLLKDPASTVKVLRNDCAGVRSEALRQRR